MPILNTPATLAPRLGDPGLLLVDTRPLEDWRAATIPGAINLNVYDYFISRSDLSGIGRMASAAARAWRAAGADRAHEVVFFEQQTGMRSPRGLWFHDLLGLKTGSILDGGIDAWVAAGGATAPGTGEAFAVTESHDAALPAGFRRELVATTAEVLGRDAATTDLLDVRRRSEFEGSFVHDCCARPGRIPDAKFLFYEDLLVDGHYRAPDDIRARAMAAGLSPDRAIVTYCHRGARAATALYGLRLAGFERIGIFVGSWHEWAGDPQLPAVLGV